MPPSYVKAYRKRSKNDANDTAAICEAVTRPSMLVPTKSEQQQSALMSHRSRQLLVRQRTMLSNAIRGHMAELGIISAKGRNGMASCCSSLPMPRMIGWFGQSWFVARDIKEPTLLTRRADILNALALTF